MKKHDLRGTNESDALFDSARESYKSIRAPQHVRAQILANREKREFFPLRSWRPAATLAGLALVVGCVLLALPKVGRMGGEQDYTAIPVATQTVSYQGGVSRMASQSDEADSDPMQVADNCIPLNPDFDCDVFIIVNRGKLLLPDGDGNLHFAGQSGPLTSGQTAYWSVDSDTSQVAPVAQLMDSHENILATITLSYQTEEGIWYASTEMKK